MQQDEEGSLQKCIIFKMKKQRSSLILIFTQIKVKMVLLLTGVLLLNKSTITPFSDDLKRNYFNFCYALIFAEKKTLKVSNLLNAEMHKCVLPIFE